MSTAPGDMQQVGCRADTPPTVSVGMPIYNGAATLRSAMDSLLAQSFGDFELIVSDNASTDGTWAMVEEYAARDARVVGLRQPLNIGANGNYSAVFRAARGRYFKWASSNDWCAPEFLERCVAHLDAHPDTVLVAPRTRLFEDMPETHADYSGDIALDDADPVARMVTLCSSLRLNNAMNGLVRTDVLRRTPLIEHYQGADVVLLMQLALLGKIELLNEPLFYRRMDAATATRLMSRDAVLRHHYPVRTWRSLFPRWRVTGGRFRALLSSGLPPTDIARALPWLLRETYWSSTQLRQDLIDALRFAVRR